MSQNPFDSKSQYVSVVPLVSVDEEEENMLWRKRELGFYLSGERLYKPSL